MKIQLTPSKEVYNYCEPYIIAEIGANHNGDIELAKRMIDSAVSTGADAVKFQSWTPDSLISKEEYDRNQTYNDSKKKHFGSLKEMVEAYYLNKEQHYELAEYCKAHDVDFLSTPFSKEEADLLQNLNVPFFKIASMDLNNLELLKYTASFGKTVVLSTGMGSLAEIETAVETIEKQGNSNIVLLHCISIYPPAYEDIHLNNIPMLEKTFGYPVGFSDHTIGTSIPLASVALGACIIEKHFTTDKNLPGWDHEISADPNEMKEICLQSKNIVRSLGSWRRTVSKAEQEKKFKFRRSVVAAKSISKGKKVSLDDFLFKRPGTGISPNEVYSLVGKIVSRDIAEDQVVSWEDFV
ncbi:polysaccharide biosynthesis protein [Leptospira gomenensis]|uniref:Polysaccharide biosynthesis protein n=1 Tax=Leptospira gomenensis TaxID=2484974 RepID=A0A5F1Z054_9LEPT|nr:N-acetylneuraminate synthase family protein [Leptospira gomenensis]TGK30938.1 polysaccharide biosynthesis protein [Leptospira gomenensis]TGK38180.1 polysaccharide biosynthesis protein [Leptospira gomenensis]TGK45342.1 polysaccharide biosynthesis protein [Leptospira gomenensis]TGK66255.1 polysaccharide biosynthesis protein [Leptospira gomenensis]